MKTSAKNLLLGAPGPHPRIIRVGLLSGLGFHVDTACKSQRLLGLDEREIASPLRRLACRCRTAIDIGANDGWYSLYFASLAGISKVFAFEPAGVHHEIFEANFRLNRAEFRGKVELLPLFVGVVDGADSCTLDSRCGQCDGPVIVKLDVDGGEVDVLEGGRGLLSRQDVSVICETHSAELEERCVRLLKDLQYRVEIIPNGWYRALVPEHRPIPHNRWLMATR